MIGILVLYMLGVHEGSNRVLDEIHFSCSKKFEILGETQHDTHREALSTSNFSIKCMFYSQNTFFSFLLSLYRDIGGWGC